MEYVIRKRDLGTIDNSTTSADLKIDDEGPGFIPIVAAVYPRTTGSPALGGATGLKLQSKAESDSSPQDHGATTDVTSALLWKIDSMPASILTATWDGTPDGSSTVGLDAIVVYRKGQLRS